MKVVYALLVILFIVNALVVRECFSLSSKVKELKEERAAVAEFPKIAFVDMEYIFKQYRKREFEQSKIDTATQSFKQKIAEPQEELVQLEEQINAARQELQTAVDWSDQKRMDKENALRQLILDARQQAQVLREREDNFRVLMSNQTQKITDALFAEIYDVAQRKGKSMGYDLVINSKALDVQGLDIFVKYDNNDSLADAVIQDLNRVTTVVVEREAKDDK